jgi:hypothetical protein
MCIFYIQNNYEKFMTMTQKPRKKTSNISLSTACTFMLVQLQQSSPNAFTLFIFEANGGLEMLLLFKNVIIETAVHHAQLENMKTRLREKHKDPNSELLFQDRDVNYLSPMTRFEK